MNNFTTTPVNTLCPMCGYGTIKPVDDDLVCDHCQIVLDPEEP